MMTSRLLLADTLELGEHIVASGDSRLPLWRLPYRWLLRGYYLVLTDRRLLGLAHTRLLGRSGSLAFARAHAEDDVVRRGRFVDVQSATEGARPRILRVPGRSRSRLLAEKLLEVIGS